MYEITASFCRLHVLFAEKSSAGVFTFLDLKVSAMRYKLERNLALLFPIITELLGLFCLSLTEVAGIHPECKIFQQVVKEEALCLEKNESVSPDLKGNSPDCQALI